VSRTLDRHLSSQPNHSGNHADIETPNSVQLNALRGMSYAEGREALKPANSLNANNVQMHGNGTSHEHEAREDARVSGPIGRIFNTILGVEVTREDTGLMVFDVGQLREFLDVTLKLSEGEWFRGTKLERVAEALMGQLDTNQDGLVGWGEFQGFQEEVLKNLAPGIGNTSTPEDVRNAAESQYSKLNSDTKGSPDSVTFSEMQDGIGKELPVGTKNVDIISQLAARIAMYAVDKDETGKDLKKRSVTESEWSTAALEIHAVGKENNP